MSKPLSLLTPSKLNAISPFAPDGQGGTNTPKLNIRASAEVCARRFARARAHGFWLLRVAA